VAIALSIAFGFVGGAGSTQSSPKDQNLSGTLPSSKRMAAGKEWTTARRRGFPMRAGSITVFVLSKTTIGAL